MIGLGFSLGLVVGAALGGVAAGLVVYLWLERRREDAAADRELVETWANEPLRPAFPVGYPEPLSPRLHERRQPIIATARVRQPAEQGEGRHRASEAPEPPLRMWEPGEFTGYLQRHGLYVDDPTVSMSRGKR